MKHITYIIIILTFVVLPITGCTSNKAMNAFSIVESLEESGDILMSGNENQPKQISDQNNSYVHKKISAQEAKEMMDQFKDYIILDVRTPDEYRSGYIKDAILIPDYEITRKVEKILDNKDTPILMYCRSGRRSALVMDTLKDLGYTTVYDFGGIIDWPYEIIVDNE